MGGNCKTLGVRTDFISYFTSTSLLRITVHCHPVCEHWEAPLQPSRYLSCAGRSRAGSLCWLSVRGSGTGCSQVALSATRTTAQSENGAGKERSGRARHGVPPAPRRPHNHPAPPPLQSPGPGRGGAAGKSLPERGGSRGSRGAAGGGSRREVSERARLGSEERRVRRLSRRAGGSAGGAGKLRRSYGRERLPALGRAAGGGAELSAR